ncbi:spore coat protein YlbD [Amphibacillus sediminis]|uniref:spore coat protein YlbD n=1 Tax=Amphibacillus sediminis TaxID=360185 RepID=UPI00082C06B2|nr:spore coat protein YlbD [Amphibacillus sediminis]
MSGQKLHPEVEKFKAFVVKHPVIIREVKSGKHDWQYYFDQYQTLGERDKFWEPFKTKQKQPEKKKGLKDQLMSLVSKIDFNNLDQHVNQMDQAVTQVKQLIDQFSNKKGQQNAQQQQVQPPFRAMGPWQQNAQQQAQPSYQRMGRHPF